MPYTQCYLCGDRDARVPVAFQTNVIDMSAEDATALDPILGSALQLGLMPTCEMMEAYLYSVDEDEDTCSGFLDLALSQCGCGASGEDAPPAIDVASGPAAVANPCDPCPGAVPDPARVLDLSPELFGAILGDASSVSTQWTCGALEVFAPSLESGSGICSVLTEFAYLCGCNGGVRAYLGADTKTKQAVLAWLPPVTGLLSIVGSSLIIADIAKNPQHKKSLRHQLLFGLSIGDIIGSLSYCLSTLPIPKYSTSLGYFDLGFYGAEGNEKTCTAQGFFVQVCKLACKMMHSFVLRQMPSLCFSRCRACVTHSFCSI